jgi:transcriptional regulator with PAS, ATPase and Fis domain
MSSLINVNELVTLNSQLLMNLDEDVFFSKLSGFIHTQMNEFKVQIFEASSDGSTQLRAQNGEIIINGDAYAKGQGLSGYVVKTKRAYYSNSAKRDPLLANSVRDSRVESELCVPMISEGTVLGTIHIQSINPNRKFSDSDISEVLSILNSINPSVRNMRLYILAKNMNRELTLKVEEKEKELELRSHISIAPRKFKEKIELVGHCSNFVNAINMAKKVANEDLPVLLVGESGTGKKLLAKKMHSLSDRKESEVVIAHCSAIDASTLEVELFGRKGRPGIFERANGGTLILDDVSELPLPIQGKILRAMTSGEIHNVDSDASIAINVRIIATSKVELTNLIKENKFREDLGLRLSTVMISLPALRSREEDIRIMAEYFLNLGKDRDQAKTLTSKAIEKLSNYNWPGNVHELKNIMERTYLLADDKFIDEQHLPNFVQEEAPKAEVVETFNEMTLFDLEKNHIMKTLDFLGGNKTRAAKSLGITVKTLYNKLHSYGIAIGRME